MTLESVLIDILIIVAIIGVGFLVAFLKGKTKIDRDVNIWDICNIAASAAEQMFINGQLTSGQRKATAIGILNEFGIDYEEGSVIDNCLEAAVRQLNIDQKISRQC